MDMDAVQDPVLKAYARKYPQWTETRVTSVVEHAFGGTLVTVRATTGRGIRHSELCFVDDDGKVTIYDSSEELARSLEARAKLGWFYRLFTRPIFTSLIFLFLLVAVFVAGFFPKGSFDSQALTALAGVLGTAAGFFFSTQPRK